MAGENIDIPVENENSTWHTQTPTILEVSTEMFPNVDFDSINNIDENFYATTVVNNSKNGFWWYKGWYTDIENIDNDFVTPRFSLENKDGEYILNRIKNN